MIFKNTGQVHGNFYVTGLSSYPIYLFDSPSAILIEGGATCGGNLYLRDIRSILGGREPQIIFLTHVHWDHCGAVSVLKRSFPSLKVAASPKAAEILKKKSALELITRLNHEAVEIVKGYPGLDPATLINEPFVPFEIDMELKDGDVIELGGGSTVQVIAAPGHTRDFLSYYLPKEKILMAGEAAGCLDEAEGSIITEFVYSYDEYFSSLKRLSKIPAEILCQGHRIIFLGEDRVRDFFDESIDETLRFRDRVCQVLEDEKGDVERVIERIKSEQYDHLPFPKQPLATYLLNLRAQVLHLAGNR